MEKILFSDKMPEIEMGNISFTNWILLLYILIFIQNLIII